MKTNGEKYSRDTGLRPVRIVHANQSNCTYPRSRYGPEARVTTAFRNAFTLIEMLVATVLAAILMSAVLAMLVGVSRDRKTLGRLTTDTSATGFVDLIRWDLSNAQTLQSNEAGQSVTLIGMGGIDASTRSPNGRLVQVTYQMQSHHLWRIQEYLDDPAHPGMWQELAAANVSNFSVDSSGASEAPVPPRLRLRFSTPASSIDQVLWIK